MNQAMGLSIVVAAISKRIVANERKNDVYYHSKHRVIPALMKVGHRRRVDVNNAMLHFAGIDIEHTPSQSRIKGTLHKGTNTKVQS